MVWLQKRTFSVRSTGTAGIYADGHYNHSVWENKEALPLFCYAWVTGEDHVRLAEENQLLWNKWFYRWEIDSDGVIAIIRLPFGRYIVWALAMWCCIQVESAFVLTVPN